MNDLDVCDRIAGFIDKIEAGANEGMFYAKGKRWICLHQHNYLDVLADMRAMIDEIKHPPIMTIPPIPAPKPKLTKKGPKHESGDAREDSGSG